MYVWLTGCRYVCVCTCKQDCVIIISTYSRPLPNFLSASGKERQARLSIMKKKLTYDLTFPNRHHSVHVQVSKTTQSNIYSKLRHPSFM